MLLLRGILIVLIKNCFGTIDTNQLGHQIISRLFQNLYQFPETIKKIHIWQTIFLFFSVHINKKISI